MIRHDIILEDTTLRDGEQAPGVAFSKDTKLRIFDKLIAAGVRWIEPGIPPRWAVKNSIRFMPCSNGRTRSN